MKHKIILVLIFVFIVIISFNTTIFGYWPKPEVLSLSTNIGTNNKVINLTIRGDKFAKSVVVELTRSGYPEIVADNVRIISQNEITCTLDLNGKTAGTWDITVINMNRFLFFSIPKLVIVLNGFTIVPLTTGMEISK